MLSPFLTIVLVLVAAALAGVLVTVVLRALGLRKEVGALQGANGTLLAKITQLGAWLDTFEKDVQHLNAELTKRPILQRKTFKILTLGMKATGKTSLTLKWSNPLVNLGTIEGTKIERYERTVSHVREKDVMLEHVFEVHDWGGEHIVDAQQELIVEEINGLLVVVDLGGRDSLNVDMARVTEQIEEFQPQALRYFFGPKTVASCKTVVLFINKSDLIAGTPAEVELEAKRLYAPLINNLMKYKNQVDVKVFVGSASYGHSTHLLFAHFVDKILPKNAYDAQLLRGMKADFVNSRVPPLEGVSSHPHIAHVLPQAAPEVVAFPPAVVAAGAPRPRLSPPLAPSFGIRPLGPTFVQSATGINDTAPLIPQTAQLLRKA